MAVLPIKIFPDPILRRTAEELGYIGDREKQLIANMKETMFAAPGAGLAAPQVGEPIRLIVVNLSDEKHPGKSMTLINPAIVFREGEDIAEEGCLSILNYQTDIKRSSHVIVQYSDPKGRQKEIDAYDFLARVLQHEIDHLNGILFFDHLGRIKRDIVKRKLIKGSKKKDIQSPPL